MTTDTTCRVYICSPYRGDIQGNTDFTRAMCRRAYQNGYEPIAPHLYYPQWLDDENPAERQYGMNRGLELIAMCDELWVCGETVSSGMRAEIDRAKELGVKIMEVIQACSKLYGATITFLPMK